MKRVSIDHWCFSQAAVGRDSSRGATLFWRTHCLLLRHCPPRKIGDPDVIQCGMKNKKTPRWYFSVFFYWTPNKTPPTHNHLGERYLPAHHTGTLWDDLVFSFYFTTILVFICASCYTQQEIKRLTCFGHLAVCTLLFNLSLVKWSLIQSNVLWGLVTATGPQRTTQFWGLPHMSPWSPLRPGGHKPSGSTLSRSFSSAIGQTESLQTKSCLFKEWNQREILIIRSFSFLLFSFMSTRISRSRVPLHHLRITLT